MLVNEAAGLEAVLLSYFLFRRTNIMDKERYQNGLGNLKLMIQRASTKYANEFVWQDVNLTDEFKNAYTAYL